MQTLSLLFKNICFHPLSYSCLLFSIICTSLACQNSTEKETNFETQTHRITGKAYHAPGNGHIILFEYNPVTQVKTPIDTATLYQDSSFDLNYEFTEPNLYRIEFFKQHTEMLAIDNGQINIYLKVNLKETERTKIEGSEDSQKLLDYEKFRQESNERLVKPTYEAMRVATKSGHRDAEVEAVQNYAHASEKHRQELIDFTFKNIGTSVALYGTMLRWTGDESIEKLETLIQDFKKVHPNLSMTKAMEDKVNRFKKIAIGSKVAPIVLPTPEGKMLSLTDLNGKYTLIDFWASWCRPCLLQVPDLKAAYDQYHPKGFKIFSVSVDSKEDRWKAAIAKYEMNWAHVSDLKGWASEAAADYNVTFIPFNLLIDKDGVIIAKNLHSKALMQKLESLMFRQAE